MKKLFIALCVLFSLASAVNAQTPVPVVSTPTLSPTDCIGYWWINLSNARLTTSDGSRQPILPAYLTIKIRTGQVSGDGMLSCSGVVAVSGNSGVNLFVNAGENITYINLSMPASIVDGENQTHSLWVNLKLFGSPRDNNLPGIIDGSFRNNVATTPKEKVPFMFHGDGDFSLMQRGNPDDGRG